MAIRRKELLGLLGRLGTRVHGRHPLTGKERKYQHHRKEPEGVLEQKSHCDMQS